MIKTDKQKFYAFMKKQGFKILGISGVLDLIPTYQKTEGGDYVLISGIWFCFFDGVDTPKGDLGCITFCYGGKKRSKYQRNAHQAEILKKSFCPKNLTEVKEEYKNWLEVTRALRKTWETII